MNTETIFWVAFIAIFFIGFAVDMIASKRRQKQESVAVALKWTAIWVSIALSFGFAIYFFYPQNPDAQVVTRSVMGLKFFSAYLTEYMLSIDNLFVFIMIFTMMKVRADVQPILLKLGILLSIILRCLFILVGMGLIDRFEWLIYLFGAFLILMTVKMIKSGDEDETIDPDKNVLIRTAKRFFQVDVNNHGPVFLSKMNGKWALTPFTLTFLLIGSTDVMFAIDSVPAVIGVIQEGNQTLSLNERDFLAISSNVFACMGLVSLFFALEGIIKLFRYLKTGICFILFFVGAKMMLCGINVVEEFFSHHSWVSFAVILATLFLSIVFSMIASHLEEKRQNL